MEQHKHNSLAENDNQQFVLSARLPQEVVRMRHVDDLFFWLTENLVRQLHIEVAQVWTRHITPTYQQTIALRASSLYDTSMSEYNIINPAVMQMVTVLLSQQQNMLFQPVGNLFSSYQSNLLRRYGLNYCVCCFITINVIMPASLNRSLQAFSSYLAREETTGPIIIGLLGFLAEPCTPVFLNSMYTTLQQTLYLGQRQGLFYEAPAVPYIALPQPVPALQLYQLIPVRVRPADSMLSSSPLTRTVPISNKYALAFLSAIDGTKTVAEIAIMKRISEKDLKLALAQLLKLERIQMYSSDGKLIKNELLSKMM